MTSAFDTLVALHETLTTPDSEDWLIVADRDAVHIAAIRETEHKPDATKIEQRLFLVPLAEFKRSVENLPPGHNLGCLTFIVCQDNKATGAGKLLSWLNGQARHKNFSMTSLFGTASTKAAIRSMESRFALQ
jgi:hypothetical protein